MTANLRTRAAILLAALTLLPLPGCIGFYEQPGHEKGQGGVDGPGSGDTGPAGVGATSAPNGSGRPAGVETR